MNTTLQQERQTATRFGHALTEKQIALEAEIAAIAEATARRVCEGGKVGDDALNLLASLELVKQAIVVLQKNKTRLGQQIVAAGEAEEVAERERIKSAKDVESIRLTKGITTGKLIREDGFRNKMFLSSDGEIILQDMFDTVMESLGPENGPKHLERMNETARTQSYFARPK